MTTDRYHRQRILPHFGTEAQQRLASARVLVAGAGGLGVPVLQYLTGMGVGTIGMADGDRVQLTNLHRQVLYTEADLDQPKALVAADRLAAANSSIRFLPHPEHLTPGNALTLLRNYDLVIDATDNFAARYLINDACVLLRLPFVYGAVHRYEGQVSVFNYRGGPTYRCLYPVMPAASEIPDCHTGGVLGVAPGIVGCYMALEAVKLLTGLGDNLSGKLLHLDLLTNEQYTIRLKAHPANRQITRLADNYAPATCTAIPNLAVRELAGWLEQKRPFSLLDLRDEEDFETAHIDSAQLFTTRSLQHSSNGLLLDRPAVTICYRGHRSLQAAQYLTEKYPGLPVYHVAAGMDGWQAELGEQYLIHD